ncbi:hypothetical protein DFP72DRAFT_1005664 [Ephemerocybe angulata]|uniref:Uncharacterized protein n=1 Tax=Ephemerocybe angulata TaxID=980116 RepID=A0A8H6I770_9AGAR|nr:hypothetical protein DFP72DRAFT_1005664 [Tulosesus angulatus]
MFSEETTRFVDNSSAALCQLSPSTGSQSHSALHFVDGGEPWGSRRGGKQHTESPQDTLPVVAERRFDRQSFRPSMDQLPYSPPSTPYHTTGPNQLDQAYPSQFEANPPYGNTNVVGLPPLETIDPAILATRFQSFLPIDFPQHLDSMLAELFPAIISQSIPPSDTFMALTCRPLIMLDMLRQASLTLHRGDVEETPTMLSYATVSQYPLKITRFGVTAPRHTSLGRGLNMAHGLGKTVRAFRVRNGWNVGGYPVPPATELWRHGNCAEMQAIPAVVDWCESLGMENVVIYSLAMHKSGNETARMCKNCIAYIKTRVLARNPSWVVVDVSTGVCFTTYGYGQAPMGSGAQHRGSH